MIADAGKILLCYTVPMNKDILIGATAIVVIIGGFAFLGSLLPTPSTGVSILPERVSVVGYWECLPHRNATGPQTKECMLGLALDQSDGHLALDLSLMSSYAVDLSVGTKVRVEGIFIPANQLSTNQWDKYDIDGVLSATAIKKVQ